MYSHYVVVLDWADRFGRGVDILGVTHTYEEAKEIYDKHLVDEKECAKENDYTVETEDATTFDAGIFGEWDLNHITLYIQGVN